ncbi:acetylornithine deacetylase/succinyl-diaminopimelate desuccinylase-like protein [Mycolicibacterium litorale]|nr:acetylornithine deacetylase/succinyl-diaminopimelate desuccinylase-like protein [Mycolicibacterium litorale]
MMAAAEWIAARLARITDNVRIVGSATNPVVLARVRGRHVAGTTVIYGHLDVKPPGPGWSSPPFEPVRRGLRLFARGASDDKGQLMAHVAAVEAWGSVGGPPGDVVLVVDAAEEVGSPGLAATLTGSAGLTGGEISAIVVSDTKMVSAGQPSLTVSQRGMLGLDVRVSTRRPAVHAGRYGGVVADPTLVLASGLLSAARAVTRVRAGGDRAHSARAGAALSVTSCSSGTVPGSIPPAAKATLDVRLPAGVDPAAFLPVITAALRGTSDPRVDVEVACAAISMGLSMRHPADTRAAIDRACRLAFGKRAVEVPSGGSIPAVAMLAHAVGRAPILLGLGPPDDGAHGPDEHIDLADWAKSLDAAVCLLQLLPTRLDVSRGRHSIDLGTRLIHRGPSGPRLQGAVP